MTIIRKNGSTFERTKHDVPLPVGAVPSLAMLDRVNKRCAQHHDHLLGLEAGLGMALDRLEPEPDAARIESVLQVVTTTDPDVAGYFRRLLEISELLRSSHEKLRAQRQEVSQETGGALQELLVTQLAADLGIVLPEPPAGGSALYGYDREQGALSVEVHTPVSA